MDYRAFILSMVVRLPAALYAYHNRKTPKPSLTGCSSLYVLSMLACRLADCPSEDELEA